MDSPNKALIFAYLTATACTIYIVENLLMRMLPIPFLRLGLSNIVILYLVMNTQYVNAIVINVLKSVVGGLFTFSLLTPLTILSICGGMVATVLMVLLIRLRIGFSIIGISIAGAVIHNVVQLVLVRYFVIPNGSVYKLLPLMVAMGLGTGMIIAMITLKLDEQVGQKVLRSGSGYEKDNK